MNWFTALWPMIAGASLTLGAMHLLVWLRDRRARGNLAFAGLAVCVTGISVFELAMTRAHTLEEFVALLSGSLVPVFFGFVCILAFVRLYFQTGRLWLAHATWILRLAGMVFNFISPPHLIYRRITELHQAELLGATITVAKGIPSPWLWLYQLSVLSLLAFVADAAFALWRRGGPMERRRAVVIGGSLTTFILLAGVLVALVHRQVIAAPYLVSLPFLFMILAMGYEMSHDVLRAAELARELRESEQRMELAAGAAQLGLWAWEIPQDRIWATDQCRDMYGIPPRTAITLDRFLSAMHEEDRDGVRQAVAVAVAGGGKYEREYRIQLPDATPRWIAARGQVEFDSTGNPLIMRGVSLDITARMLAEAEVRRHRQELAHVTRVSTMGELAGSLAHELNQPLTAILSNAQAALRFLQQDHVDMDEFRDILKDIVADDQRAREVILRMRAMLRKDKAHVQPLDLNEVIHEVLRIMRSELVARNVTVTTDLAPRLPLVRGDRIQLQQVLLNLMVNGCDAMSASPTAERRLTLETGRETGDHVRVSVMDQGAGVAAGDREKIFDPFFSTKAHGMGMGLPVCRAIVTVHGGRVWLTDHDGRGTVFHFTVPVHREDEA